MQGDRSGRIVVRSRVTNAVVLTVNMPSGVVREIFLLDGEHVLAASQAASTYLWELPSGRLKKTMAARTYGFSHAGTIFITQTGQGVGVRAYPSGKLVCRLAAHETLGIEGSLFSPDDRYLALLFASGRPSDDAHYPGPSPVYRSAARSLLFDLHSCAEVGAFTRLKATELGVFSSDSRYYDLTDTIVETNGDFLHGSWRFDLTAGTLARLSG